MNLTAGLKLSRRFSALCEFQCQYARRKRFWLGNGLERISIVATQGDVKIMGFAEGRIGLYVLRISVGSCSEKLPSETSENIQDVWKIWRMRGAK